MSKSGPAAAAQHDRADWLEDGGRPLDWNGPVDRLFVRFTDEDMHRSIIDLVERVVLQQPDRVAVRDADTSLTYSELWDGASGLAATIAERTRPGELVGILLPACPRFPLAMLACLAAGRPFVALDPHYPREWIDKVLEDARPALVIGNGDALPAIQNGSPATQMIDLTDQPRVAPVSWRPAFLGLDEPACVLFTSGSTGRPKGIVNSQRNLLQRAAQSINAAHINAGDRFLTLASLCTIVGVRDVVTALLAGATVRLIDPQRAGAREILNVIRTDAITILFAFPALLRSVMASNLEPAGNALRLVRLGGDTMFWGDMDLIRTRLAPKALVQLVYAATEAPMMQWFVDVRLRDANDRIPIGYPLPGNRLAVIGEDGCPAAPGEYGELVVKSAYVSVGIWKDGRCALEDVERDPASGLRLFRTGDIVRQRPDGLLERIGRKDRQVKIRGARVDLDGVESALRQHPFVQDVGVVARTTDGEGGPALAAYVSAKTGAPVRLLKQLREKMRAEPASMRPAYIYLVREIPRLPNSKLDVRALAALDAVREHSAREEAAAEKPVAGDRVARAVTQVWQNVLQAPVSGPGDDFFEAGGDSLKAIAFTLEVEQALNLEIPVTLINEAPTIGEFCAALRDDLADRYVPLVLLKAGDRLPPVFFIHGVGGNVTEILPMARRMKYAGPVIGIQARGLAGREPPHTSVAAMAADYLKEIRARQPNGPYHLCGYSFGGLVAFEIARLLSASGDEVGLVGLFDTMMSPLKWPLRSWRSIAYRRTSRFGAWLISPQPKTRESLTPGYSKVAPARALKVASSALIASARYHPGRYPGMLTLFSPAGREPGLPSLDTIWRKYAREVVVVETTGAHATMLSGPNAESTAACLTRCLPAG